MSASTPPTSRWSSARSSRSPGSSPKGTRFIILDEPTAQLESREISRLFERILRLQANGVTFLYISHHLEEIYEICRSVTVLRDGEVVANDALRGTCPRSGWSTPWSGRPVRLPAHTQRDAARRTAGRTCRR